MTAAPAQPVPRRGVQRGGVAGFHLEVDESSGVVHEQHARPRLAAVGGLVDAALVVRAPEVAEGGDVDGVGAGGVDHDAADGA